MKKLFMILLLLTPLPAITATKCVQLASGTLGSAVSNPEYSSDWSVTEANGVKISGLGVCATTTASVAGTAVNSVSFNGTAHHYCWCKMTSPAQSKWIFYLYYVYPAECAQRCNYRCGGFMKNNADFRTSMFNNIIK